MENRVFRSWIETLEKPKEERVGNGRDLSTGGWAGVIALKLIDDGTRQIHGISA